MARVPQRLIDQAAHANLISFCQAKGIALKREQKEYVLVDHDSLYISAECPWKWYRHSTGEGGKAIDFCTKFLGMKFSAAVQELTSTSLPEVKIPPAQYYQPNIATDTKRVMGYLCKQRGLNYELIAELVRNGKLRQDTNGNCVFQIFDFEGNKVGAELHGSCSNIRFKGQATPQNGFGFSLAVGDEIDTLAFFESAIDLVSFRQLFPKIDNALLVSMGGLKTSVLLNYAEHYPQAKIFLCVDRDERGRQFVKEQGKYKQLVPEQGKDWNEYLLLKVNGRLEKKEGADSDRAENL